MSPDFIRRYTSRPFLAMVATSIGTTIGIVSVWRTESVPIEQKIEATKTGIMVIGGVVAAWNTTEHYKDSKIETEKLKAASPQMPTEVNAGGDVNLSTQPQGGTIYTQGDMDANLALQANLAQEELPDDDGTPSE